jgi:hypothetical protein
MHLLPWTQPLFNSWYELICSLMFCQSCIHVFPEHLSNQNTALMLHTQQHLLACRTSTRRWICKCLQASCLRTASRRNLKPSKRCASLQKLLNMRLKSCKSHVRLQINLVSKCTLSLANFVLTDVYESDSLHQRQSQVVDMLCRFLTPNLQRRMLQIMSASLHLCAPV